MSPAAPFDGRAELAPPPGPEPAVLAVNTGSSSLKAALVTRGGQPLWQGQVDGLRAGAGLPAAPLAQALAQVLAVVQAQAHPVVAVVHRIVHGAEQFTAPCLLDDAALQALATLEPLAPLHQPHNLAGVRQCAQAWPGVPQIGCFDTAFHAGLPAVERDLGLPRALARQGLRRYGFHGLAYASVLAQLQQAGVPADARVVMAHLGSGASVCAVREGRSVATSMGFSALDGLLMATRCGSLDAGVLLHLLRQGWTVDRLEQLLYREAGLLGVSGLSADVRVLRAADDPRAVHALALFTHRVVREIGALVAVLGGLDVLAFSGGVGEHDALLRADVAQALAYTGLRLDANRNGACRAGQAQALHEASSAVALWCVPADEAVVMARSAFSLLPRSALSLLPRSALSLLPHGTPAEPAPV